MDLPIPEIIGIGFVVVAFLWVALQIARLVIPSMQKRSAEDKDTLVEVIAKNARAMEKLSQSVEQNTVATAAGTEAIKVSQQREDLFTRMLVEVMRMSGRAPETTVQPPPVSSQSNPRP